MPLENKLVLVCIPRSQITKQYQMCTVSLGHSSTEKKYDSGVNETTAKKKKNVPEVFLPHRS